VTTTDAGKVSGEGAKNLVAGCLALDMQVRDLRMKLVEPCVSRRFIPLVCTPYRVPVAPTRPSASIWNINRQIKSIGVMAGTLMSVSSPALARRGFEIIPFGSESMALDLCAGEPRNTELLIRQPVQPLIGSSDDIPTWKLVDDRSCCWCVCAC